MNIDLTKSELIDLYFEISRSIQVHKLKLDHYKEIQLEQGITFEQSRIKSLEGIKVKIEKRLEEE